MSRKPIVERLECRQLLTSIAFSSVPVAGGIAREITEIVPGDFDGDGDLDIAFHGIAKHVNPPTRGLVAWHENLDGNGTFSAQRTIDNQLARGSQLVAVDTDGDQKDDLLHKTVLASHLAHHRYAAVDNEGNIREDKNSTPPSSMMADFDGDGQLDYVGRIPQTRALVWFRQAESGELGEPKNIAVGPAAEFQDTSVNFEIPADIDGDGDIDMFGSYQLTNIRTFLSVRTHAWWENDGNGNFSELADAHVIATEGEAPVFEPYAPNAIDLDGDGDTDLVYVYERGRVTWRKNDGNGQFGDPQTIVNVEETNPNYEFVDMDSDGDIDLLISELVQNDNSYVLHWYENAEVFSNEPHQLASGMAHNHDFKIGDIDGDGVNDLITIYGWQKGIDSTGKNFGNLNHVRTPFATHVVDIDNDGDLDLYTQDGVLENTGDQSFATYRPFENLPVYSQDRKFADMNSDGYPDIVTLEQDSETNDVYLVWYENNNGWFDFADLSRFDTKIDVKSTGRIYNTIIDDLDGDADLDVVVSVTTLATAEIVWLENVEGDGLLDRQIEILELSETYDVPTTVTDVDLDGDADLVSIGNVVYRNLDGLGTSWSAAEVSVPGALANLTMAIDWDGDGDDDAIRYLRYSNDIVWKENRGGSFREVEVTLLSAQAGIESMAPADMDSDGDLDLFVEFGDSYAWIENRNRTAVGPHRLNITPQFGTLLDDINGDGRVDIFARTDEAAIHWYENRVPGDSNRDLLFNSRDFVTIFQAAEYEDAISGNSTFDEGDWNGDGDFDSRDFVFAFQAGNYVAASRMINNVDLSNGVDFGGILEDLTDAQHRKKKRAFVV